jgi:hypothetical protein
MYVALSDLTSLAHDGLHNSPNLRNSFDSIGDYYKALILRIRGHRCVIHHIFNNVDSSSRGGHDDGQIVQGTSAFQEPARLSKRAA